MANIYQKLILFFIILFQVIHLTLSGCVTAPKALGMENNVILDSQISASSEYHSSYEHLEARKGRLNHPDSWSSQVLDVNQWLQVDLKTDEVTLFNISTQRRVNNNQYVTSYTISYSKDGNNFQDYTENGSLKTFQGNYDGATIVTNHFSPPIEARYIRINPKTWYYHISMRIELFGCYHEDPWRWILSRGKPATQSSTAGARTASYATNGDFNNILSPMQYSQTTTSKRPYLQIDLGKSLMVDVIGYSMPRLTDPPKMYSASFELRVGESSTVGDPANELCLPNVQISWRYVYCLNIGRYVTLQNMADDDELSITEIAVYRARSVESLAYGKTVTSSSQHSADRRAEYAVNSRPSNFQSKSEKNPWLRVNLEDSYFIYEIVLEASVTGCEGGHCGDHMEIRVGNGLENNGNSNPNCASSIDLFFLDKKSFYCSMVGQYVNVIRYVEEGPLSIGEVVVNPEITDNVAANKQGLSNTASNNKQFPRYLTDLNRLACFVSQRINQLKWVWVRLISTVMISKIFIANNPKYMDELFDFDIKVGSCSVKTTTDECCVFPFQYYNKQYYSCIIGGGGPWCATTSNYDIDGVWGRCKEGVSENYASSSYCLPGLQDMRGMETASFFCEPRVSGDHVFIKQHRADKALSICQIAVYEEAEATIVNRKKDRYVWKAINEDLTLTCEAKGYPAPLVKWIKDGTVIESSSSTLEIKSLNSSGKLKYECWANNTHGVDVKYFDLIVTSNLRVCVDSVELKHDIEKQFGWQLKGSEWYHFYDAKRRRFLQFFEKAPKSESNCQIWLNGGHPKLQNGVVSRTLCVANTSHDCSATIDVHIRTCAYYYIYNIKYSQYLIGKKYCFMNGPNNPAGVKPMIMYLVTNHALSQKVLHIETEVLESYKCLGMCHIEPRCKSVNFSKKLKLCELNTATKKEFPGNYGPSENYDYYGMGKGMTIAVKKEL